MTKIDDTIVAREQRYGRFYDNANIAQGLKFMMHSAPNWAKLEPDQKEALEQIASKIGRMLTGDFNYVDSWHDITGYAKLVENRLTALIASRTDLDAATKLPPRWDGNIAASGALTPNGLNCKHDKPRPECDICSVHY